MSDAGKLWFVSASSSSANQQAKMAYFLDGSRLSNVRQSVRWLVHQSLIVRRTQLLGMGLLISITEIWISQWYYCLLLGFEGGPWGDGWVMYHPRRSTG